MGILDASINVGLEGSYGTVATTWHAYEGQEDSWERKAQILESVGFRAGMETVLDTRRRSISLGGSGSIKVTPLTAGMDTLLRHSLGNGSFAAGEGLYEHSSNGPSGTMSVQVNRPGIDGGAQVFTHLGAAVTGLSIDQDIDKLALITVEYDYREVVTNLVGGSLTYDNDAHPFAWDDCTIRVDGTIVPATKFSVKVEHGMNVDRRYLKGSSLKSQPRRAAVPTITGSIDVEWTPSHTLYQAWLDQAVLEVEVTWSLGGQAMVVTMPACMVDGSSPKVSLSDVPKMSVPFKALDNLTDPAISIATSE